jgi:hypothetical protein
MRLGMRLALQRWQGRAVPGSLGNGGRSAWGVSYQRVQFGQQERKLEHREYAVESEVGGRVFELCEDQFEEEGTRLFVSPLHRLNYNRIPLPQGNRG